MAAYGVQGKSYKTQKYCCLCDVGQIITCGKCTEDKSETHRLSLKLSSRLGLRLPQPNSCLPGVVGSMLRRMTLKAPFRGRQMPHFLVMTRECDASSSTKGCSCRGMTWTLKPNMQHIYRKKKPVNPNPAQ
eukprot:scaffold158760_cov19-Tisochrysis_lutea.AAC.2